GVSAGFALAAGHGQPPKPTARIPGWNHRLKYPRHQYCGPTDDPGASSSAGRGVSDFTLSNATSPRLNDRTLTTFAVNGFEATKAACVGKTVTTRSGGDPLSRPSTFQFAYA